MRKRHFSKPIYKCRLNDRSVKRLKFLDVEVKNEQLAQIKKELEAMCKIKSPSIFNQTLVKICKKANVYVDFANCTKKELTIHSIYIELCQEISNRYNAAKLKSIAMVAEAFPVKLKTRTIPVGCIEDEMWQDDVDTNERRKHFNK